MNFNKTLKYVLHLGGNELTIFHYSTTVHTRVILFFLLINFHFFFLKKKKISHAILSLT
jgi:hypothetical protein